MAKAEAFPEGVRATVTLFFVDDISGMETEVAAKHGRAPMTDVAFFVSSSRTMLARMMPEAHWRLMTETEVNNFLDRQREAEPGQYSVEEA